MGKRTLALSFVGILAACVSGTTPPDTYVGKDGKTTVIETDREMCQRSCNSDYSRCMDSSAAQDNSGIVGPVGVFGASADCRNELERCLPTCKAE